MYLKFWNFKQIKKGEIKKEYFYFKFRNLKNGGKEKESNTQPKMKPTLFIEPKMCQGGINFIDILILIHNGICHLSNQEP